MGFLTRLYKFFKLNLVSVGYPYFYLGAKLKNIILHNGVWDWYLSPAKYVPGAVNNVKAYGTDNMDVKYELPS